MNRQPDEAKGRPDQEFVKEITPRAEDYSQWYIDVILKTEMMDYAPVKGCMAIRPYGFAIWERIQKLLDRRIKATGHRNAYFPLFIPQALLQKEADHVEGFVPEVAWVTRGGEETLAEPLAIRPTSEAIICDFYSRWVQSWRDLPVLVNQWCNVVRWEKSTRPFLRTSEFLWQEGHTCHRTGEEAEVETLKMLDVYREFLETEMAIPVLTGRKTEREKFAGAQRTYSVEALMSDGRALQAGTSHNLGQHFARVFNIVFLDQDDRLKYVWQTSWGVSTRLIGALIMVHGDDRGLVLPPRMAPFQVVIVPIFSKKTQERVLTAVRRVAAVLVEKGVRVELDDRIEYSPGWKFNQWEMKGVPLRIEIGPRDLEKEQAVLVCRPSGFKETVPENLLSQRVPELLETIQQELFTRALAFRAANTRRGSDYAAFTRIMETERGFYLAPWCGHDACEAKIKDETKATIRCIPFDQGSPVEGPCLACGQKASSIACFARAY